MHTAENVFPWPLKNRETCCKIGGFIDPYNRAFFLISVTVPEGQDFLGFKAPAKKKGLEPMIINYTMDYFQYISPTVTRYLSITNFDPKVSSIKADTFDGMVKGDVKKDLQAFMNWVPKLLDPKFKLYANMQQHKG
jgi:hypothetical protein